MAKVELRRGKLTTWMFGYFAESNGTHAGSCMLQMVTPGAYLQLSNSYYDMCRDLWDEGWKLIFRRRIA